MLGALFAVATFAAPVWAETIAVNQEIIGINFTTSGKLMSADANSTGEWGYYSQGKSQGGLLAENKWQNFTSLTQNKSYTIQTVDNPELSIQLEKLVGNETWGPDGSTNKLLGAYLDNASTLTLRGLPTSGYDVAIIFAGDTSSACNKYSSVEVNGVPKTYNEQGELVDGSSPWGNRVTTSNADMMCLTETGTSTTGQVMYLSGMTSSTLHIKTNAQMNNTVGRGTIAAIQIYLKSGTFEKPSVELPAPAWIWNCTGGTNSGETVYGTTLYTVSNKVIDTTTEGLKIPANNFTFSYWSKMTGGATWRNYAGFSDTNGGLMIQKSATDKINIYNSGCVGTITPACQFTLSSTTSQLLTFVSKNGTLKVYVDGVYVSETTPTNWPSFAEANPMKYFGLGIAPNTSGGSAGNGYISAYVGDARVYREALSAEQVETLYLSYLSNHYSAAYPILSMDDDVNKDGMISKTELMAETAVGNADQFCISGTVTVNKGVGDSLNWDSLTLHAANASSDSLTIAGENTLTAGTTVIGVDTTVEAGAATLGAVTVARGITLTVKDNMNAINSITNNGALRLTAASGHESAPVFDLTDRNNLKNGSGKLLLDGENPLVVNLGALGTGMKIEVESGEHTIKTKDSSGSSPYPSSTINSPTIWVKSGATLHLQSKDLIGWRSTFTSNCVIRNSGNLIWEDNPNNAGSDCYSGQWVLDNNAVLTIARTNTQSFAWRGGSESTPNVTLTSGTAEIKRKDSSKLMIHNDSTLYVKTGEASTDCLTISTPIDQDGTGSLTKTGAGTLELTGENLAQGTLTVSNGTLNLASNWAGPVTLASSATLAGTGTITGALTLNENATIDTAHGAVTVNGAVTLPSALTVKIAESQDVVDTAVPLLNAANVTIPEGMAVTVMVGETAGKKLYIVTHEEGAVKLTVAEHPVVTATVPAGGTLTLSEALNGAPLAANTILTIDFGNKGDGEAQPGTFTFDNAGTVSFAQIIVTGTNGGRITSSALTSCQTLNVQASVQLPIELVNLCANLTVAEDKTLTIDVAQAQEATLNKALSGNYTVKKSGAGTLTLDKDVNVDDGVEILAGTLKFGDGVIPYNTGDNYPATNGGNVKVHTGATLDVNGKGNAFLNMVTLCQGATYANSSSTELGNNTRQLKGITLEGNAIVYANANFGILAHGHTASTLNLGEHTLTKKGSGAFWLSNTEVSNGTLKVDLGKFEGIYTPTFNNVTFDSNSDTAFILGSGAVTAPVTKKGTGALTIGGVISGGGTVTVEAGNLTLSGNNTYTGGTTIETGATVVLGNANALGTEANVTGGGTIKSGAFVPTCDLTNPSWTGTFEFASISGSAAQGMKWEKLGKRGSKVVIPADVTITGYFHNSNWGLAAAVELNGTIELTDGYSNFSYTFSGPLTGSGTFKMSATSTANFAVLLRDVDDFTGTLSIPSTSSQNKAFIVGGTRTFNSETDKGKIIIAGEVTTDAVRTWTAKNGISVEGTLTTSLSAEETADGTTLSGVTRTSSGRIIFVRADGWRVASTTATYDPTTVALPCVWTGGGEEDTAWATAANWSTDDGHAVSAAPNFPITALTVEAGKTVTLSAEAVSVTSLITRGDVALAGEADASLTTGDFTFGGSVAVGAGVTLHLQPTIEKTVTSPITGAGKVVIGDGSTATQVSLAAEGNTIQSIDIKAQSTLAITTTANSGIDVLPPDTTVNIAESAKLNVDTERDMFANVTGPGEMEVLKVVTYIFRSGKTNCLAPGKLTLTKALTLKADREGTGLSVGELCVQAALTSTSTSKSIAEPVVTVAAGKVLSGHGSIAAPLVFKAGAIFDAEGVPEGNYLNLKDATITWPEESGTVTVKTSKTTQLIQFKSKVGVSNFTLVNTGDDTGLYLYEGTYGSTSMLNVLKKMGSASLPKEIAENEAVKEAIQAGIEKWTENGIIITEIKATTAQSTAKVTQGSFQAVDCFTNLETTVTVAPDWDGGDVSKGIATVTYDFGVSQITVKKAQLTGDTAPQNYVLACAKVSNGKTEEATAAGYARGTTVSLLLDDKVCDGSEGNGPAATALDAATLSSKFGVTAGLGEQWFALPMADLGNGTNAFKVRAKNTPQAEATP